jgi:hypothetical protein
MARRQRHDLFTPGVEAGDKCGGMQLGEGCESGVDLAFAVGLQDMEPHPLGACRFLQVSDRGLGIRTVQVHEQGDHRSLGDQLGQQLEPLGH